MPSDELVHFKNNYLERLHDKYPWAGHREQGSLPNPTHDEFEKLTAMQVAAGEITRPQAYELKLASKEFLDNEEGWSRVRTCFSGQVSDHVKTILEDNLKTEKDLDIEETKKPLDYNLIKD